MIWLIVAIVILLFVYFKFLRKLKSPKFSCISIFTGAVKTFKSGTSLHFAISKYKILHFKWSFKKFLYAIFHKSFEEEEPLFYSNIPIATVPYHDLLIEHLLRKKRFNFKSVVFVDEASLLADCYLSKFSTEVDIQVTLLKFVKLFGHATHGGYLFMNTQSMSDLNIALRKCTNQNFYIHSSYFMPILPFVLVKLREERYSEDGMAINSYNEDIEDSLKTVIVPKWILNKYDPYSFSSLTDDLPHDSFSILLNKNSSLKVEHFTSFRKEFRAIFKSLID